MRTPLGPSRTSWSLHRIPSSSDALVVTRRHARVGLLNRPMRWPLHPPLAREDVPDVDLRAEGPWNTRPVRVWCTAARERLPSYRKPASVNPQANHAMNFLSTMRNRAPFRLLSTRAPRQAVLRASSWLAPSCSTRPCDLPVQKTRDASNRLLPPNWMTCTRFTVRSRFSRATFATRDAPQESVVPTLHDRGDERFHDARTASTSPSLAFPRTRTLVPSSSRLLVTSMGLFDPRRSMGWGLWHPCRDSLLLFTLTSFRPCSILWFRVRPLMCSGFARGTEEWGGRRDHRHQRVVKPAGWRWSEVPSIVRVPS